MTKRLWEVKHPYYCNEGNYFNNDCGTEYKSWADFIAAQGDSDFDMNLVFRFDWDLPTDDDGEPMPLNKDAGYRDMSLKIFWMGQRKGLYRYSTIEVCQTDEPAVRKWLQKRYEHMLKLWQPLDETSGDQK